MTNAECRSLKPRATNRSAAKIARPILPKIVGKSHHLNPSAEPIRRVTNSGSGCDFARVLGYVDYRHYQAIIEKGASPTFLGRLANNKETD